MNRENDKQMVRDNRGYAFQGEMRKKGKKKKYFPPRQQNKTKGISPKQMESNYVQRGGVLHNAEGLYCTNYIEKPGQFN